MYHIFNRISRDLLLKSMLKYLKSVVFDSTNLARYRGFASYVSENKPSHKIAVSVTVSLAVIEL